MTAGIVSVLGHIDHGKTTLLDALSRLSTTREEPGQITQRINFFHLNLRDLSQNIPDFQAKLNRTSLKEMSVLVMDVPGHRAFEDLGIISSEYSDLVIVVIDINQGVQHETLRVLQLLRKHHRAFICALTKIDRLPGWAELRDLPLTEILAQEGLWRERFDRQLYKIMGDLGTEQIQGELFTRVTDFRRQIPLVPISAPTQVGLSELILIVMNLLRRYHREILERTSAEIARLTIIETSFSKHHGTLYQGLLREGVLDLQRPLIARTHTNELIPYRLKQLVRCIPTSTQERRIEGPSALSFTLSDSKEADHPLEVTETLLQSSHLLLPSSFDQFPIVFLDDGVTVTAEGIILRASTPSLLHALTHEILLRSEKKPIPIQKLLIGPIKKNDFLHLEQNKQPENRVVCSFLNHPTKLAHSNIQIIEGEVLYEVVDRLFLFRSELIETRQREIQKSFVEPVKLQFLPDCVFRTKQPAIVGIKVLRGFLRTGIRLMTERRKTIGTVNEIRREGEIVTELSVGQTGSIRLPDAKIDQSFYDGTILLYSEITHEQIERCWEIATEQQREVLNEIRSL